MNKVLVIGGSGFIGSHLVERLCLKGYKVVALVRKNSNTKFLNSLDVELRLGDIVEPNSLKDAFYGVDTVFCLANVNPAGKNPQEYKKELYRLHIDGTRNMMKACKINNVRRLIYFSSVAAMGYQKSIHIYDEYSPTNPIDTYGKAKLEAEKILNEASKNGELDITILRPPGVFGERGLGILEKLIFFIKKGFVPIIGSGQNRQSLLATYVGNVVNQAIFLAENNDSIGKTYITSDHRPYSVNQLINAVSKVMNAHPIKVHIPVLLVMSCASVLNFLAKIFLKRKLINKETIIAITSERIFDGSRIFRELGYSQEYDLVPGITRTIEWYKKENA